MATRKTQERIPAKELREYMKLPVDQALSKRRGEEIRILPDGRVLWTVLGTRISSTWPTREAYVEWCRKMEEEVAASRTAPNPAQVLLPPIDDFIRDVEAHAKNLGPRLRIPAEVLDFTPESLDAVDKALKQIPWAKRQVPDLVTPLVAYLGEVMRRGTGGQWTKIPTETKQVPVSVYDPGELAAYTAAKERITAAADAAGNKAKDEARARGASESNVLRAYSEAYQAVYKELHTISLAPIRTELQTVTKQNHENEPMITTRGGGCYQPFASVYLPMVEPSRRIPLRSSHGVPSPARPRK